MALSHKDKEGTKTKILQNGKGGTRGDEARVSQSMTSHKKSDCTGKVNHFQTLSSGFEETSVK